MVVLAARNEQNLLTISGLNVDFDSPSGPVSVLRGVDLSLDRGETLALVGESGCGKSLTALAVMGLVPPPGRISAGRIGFDGLDLVGATPAQRRGLRGGDMGMIFQEPMTSLNPVFTVGEQITEAIMQHIESTLGQARERAEQVLALVGMPSARERLGQYPHELSGGMRQRVMIAMAVACKPSLLIADEPTTALDATIQAQILGLIATLKTELNLSVLLITHNLGLVAQTADRVAIMYAGEIVEYATVRELFKHPRHPYTQALLASIPRAGRTDHRLPTIAGQVPPPERFQPGCRFSDRCGQVMDTCRVSSPGPTRLDNGHTVNCWLQE